MELLLQGKHVLTSLLLSSKQVFYSNLTCVYVTKEDTHSYFSENLICVLLAYSSFSRELKVHTNWAIL